MSKRQTKEEDQEKRKVYEQEDRRRSKVKKLNNQFVHDDLFLS
jgi:hypothetical protein